MNCSTHTEVPAVAFCRSCGRALCADCRRVSDGVVYCAEHATPPAAASYSADPYHAAPPPPPPGHANPGLAFVLGFIPGVGAMYNGQFAKGLAHLAIFAIFVTLTAMHAYARDLGVPDSWSLLIRQTDTLHQQGKLADAERSGRLALIAASGVDSDERLPITHAILASVYRDQGRCAETRVHYARAAALYQKQLHPKPKYVFSAIVGLIGEACE